uniref:TMEM175 family protein n=1 Tax=Cephaloticoccus sp. TaxID=1985742 RepID=UPI00404B89B0
MHLLFCLSLLPFATGWMGENHFNPTTVGLYGFGLLMAAIAFLILVNTLISTHGTDSTLAIAMGDNRKGTVSIFIYVIGTALTWWNSWLSIALFTGVAVMWLIPDRRIERHLSKRES